ncbi:MAG: DeoR family transcriptional regulator [Aquificota bacterium]|nr:DeoR family transcriptional regulator [Aquificota bacterium]
MIEEGFNTAKELSRYFNVSLMTIYRDLKELEEEGRIVRRHGYIELKKEEEPQGNACAVCGKDVELRLAFIYILKGGRRYTPAVPTAGL